MRPSSLEGHAVHRGGVPVQDEHGLPDVDVPEPDRAVATPRDQPAAIGAECDALDTADVAAERVERPPRLGVPDADRLVVPARRQSPSIAAVGNAAESAGVALKGHHGLPRAERRRCTPQRTRCGPRRSASHPG